MKVALYLRMSTDKQDTSIQQQRTELERYAKKHGHEIVQEYRDEGISGDDAAKRKGFQRMIAEAPTGDFDLILCWDQDRFGRFDMIEAGRWISPLRDAGVNLETIAQGPIDWNDFAGRLIYAVAQEGKHQFLRDLSRNCLRRSVQKAKAADGMYGGNAPYGYRRESTTVGRRRITKLVPHEFEAEVVRRIFETYCGTAGTLLAVGEMLNREQIPSPGRRAPWHRNAVRRILRNRTYVGDYIWGRTASGKYNVRAGEEIVPARRGSGRRRAASDPIVHEGILPALVTQELFDKAQELLDSRRRATRRPGTVRPLSGLITCAKCGSPMHVNFGDYRCSRSVDFGDGSRCTTSVARGDYLLRAIGEQLQQRILAPKKLAAFKAKLMGLVKAKQKEAAAGGTAGLERQIGELERQISEGIARIPLLPKSLVPEMAKGLDAMRQQRDMLKRQRDSSKPRKKTGKAFLESRIDEAIAAAYGLPKVLADGDPAAVNHRLRELGVQVIFDDRRARVVIDSLNPQRPVKPGGNAVLTRNARALGRDKSPSSSAIVFEIEIPRENKARRPRRAS